MTRGRCAFVGTSSCRLLAMRDARGRRGVRHVEADEPARRLTIACRLAQHSGADMLNRVRSYLESDRRGALLATLFACLTLCTTPSFADAGAGAGPDPRD